MRLSRNRLTLIAAALIVLSLWLSGRLMGIGLATNSPKLNVILFLLALVVIFVQLCAFSAARVALWLRICAGLLAIPVFLMCLVTALVAPMPSATERIGESPAGWIKLVAYSKDIPFDYGAVLVQTEFQLAPGLYAYKEKYLLDPAWGAEAQPQASGSLRVTFLDDTSNVHSVFFTP